MPEFKNEPPEKKVPELDRKVWGEDEVVLHEGTSEGSWIKAGEDDFVPIER